MKKKLLFLAGVLAVLVSVCIVSLSQRKNKEEGGEAYLKIYGVVKMGDGWGRQSVELIKTLKNDVSIAFVPTRPMDLKDVPSDVKPLLLGEQKRAKCKVALLEDVVRMPGHSPWKKLVKRTSPDDIRIAYSMQESTRIPAEWVYILNSYFDAVAVPDHFLVEAYKRSGIEIPVFELPLGLYLDQFFQEPLKQNPHDVMVFGNLGSCIERKNHLLLVKAFAEAFGNRDDVSLRINYRYGDEPVIKSIKEEISKRGLQNVHFTSLALDNTAYLRFFKSIDCYVSLSKGEGFSIQPREAMALGIPTIVTDNTAQTTICESGIVRVVHSEIPEAASYNWGGVYGKRFDCTLEDATQALLDVFENYQDHLKKAQAAREWASQYQYTNLKGLYLSLIKPKKVILGDEDKITEEYLMTTSESLYNKYKKL